jgi:predicted PurR-regulated permease PerM
MDWRARDLFRSTAVLTVASGLALVAVGLPLWKPLLLAAVLAGALSTAHERLARALGSRRGLSAALVTAGVVAVGLAPLAVVAVVVVKQAIRAVEFVHDRVQREGAGRLLAPLPDWLEREIERALAGSPRGPHDLPGRLARWPGLRQALGALAALVGSTTRLALAVGLTLVALFFLLRDGPALIEWAEGGAAMPPGRLRALLLELRAVSRSVLGAQLVSGLAQAVVATIGYLAAGVPSPVLFGALSLAASFIPIGGVAAFVGAPLAGLLWLTGSPGRAVFVLLWTALLTGAVDYLVRPLVVRGGTKLPGGVVFFALLGGLMTFGPIGLIVGPLVLALFLSASAVARRDRTGA